MSEAEWRPNPDDSATLRWWDGERWTEHTHPVAATVEQAKQPGRLAQWTERARTEVMLQHATYLGGFVQQRSKKIGTLFFRAESSGLGILGPKTIPIPNSMIASIEVTGGEVAKRKIAATVAFGTMGALAAKGAKMQTVVIVRTTDGGEGYFELDKTSPQQARAKLAPWLAQQKIPWREDQERGPAAAPLMASVADELQKLAFLRDSGVLTDAEFAATKARLISG